MFCINATARTGGLVFGFPGIPGVIDISDLIHSFDHDKSSSISQLINSKSRDLQKLLKYLNGTSASSILLLFGVLPIIFVLYSKDLLVTVLLLFNLLLALSFSFGYHLLHPYNNSKLLDVTIL